MENENFPWIIWRKVSTGSFYDIIHGKCSLFMNYAKKVNQNWRTSNTVLKIFYEVKLGPGGL